ncbi:hypothetical protein M514_28477, partial [Trichuris suis]
MTIVDDFSLKVIVACPKAKSEAAERLMEFIRMAERQKEQKKSGIKHERSNVETPQMNGVAERVNRTMIDLVRSTLKSTYAYTTRQGRKKLDERAEPGITVGYGIRSVGYRIWLPGRDNGIDVRHVAPPEWVMTDSDYEDDAAERESNVGTSVSDAPKSEESEGPHELQASKGKGAR